jgi:hydroxylamine dehydrogenase
MVESLPEQEVRSMNRSATKMLFVLVGLAGTARSQPTASVPTSVTQESAACIECHKQETPGIYQEWGTSKHYRANVGCWECHGADPKDPDAMDHNGFTIAVIVSPKDCARCHEKEAREFAGSHHSDAAKILGSLDNVLAEVVEGNAAFMGTSAAAVNGCWQCHGSEVKVEKGGKLSVTTWPNTGIGRLNPDGSKGACSACHVRHAFSTAQARRPENCGKCHLGPDHPQKEIYDESKHGVTFYANVEKMNLQSSKWIVGEDYTAAPTCATCHMSATRDLPVTHDVGDRISWTLRPAVSEKIDAAAKAQGLQVKPWEKRRDDMKNVCRACHASPFVDGFYTQFDGLVELYNEKFAKPGARIMKALKDAKLITADTDFDDKIEWTWYKLWHHQGRRARQGASMNAPDYTQWHGMFEVAEIFYTEFVPQARELIAQGKAASVEKAKAAKEAEKVLDEVLNGTDHAWSIGKMSAEEKERRKKAREEFQKRYSGP